MAARARSDSTPPTAAVRFTLPTLPERLNVLMRRHPMARGRERRRLRGYVRLFARRRTPIEWPADVRITFFTLHGRGDPDAYSKPLLDALQGIVLVTDSPKWVRSLTQSVRKGHPRTEIELTPAREEP
jgi:Holliday junction resolvase RusA-like endonuclease